MENEEIARRFERLALIMEIRGDDRYRVRSYRNAAEIIETWPVPVAQIARAEGAKGLQAIPSVGRAISSKIVELSERGTFEAYEKLTAETPETVLELLDVSGVGIKTAATLYQQFKISSREDLKQFVAGGGLEMVDGVGERTAERIAASLKVK
ncbi:MAG TPA: helix-hairpin-helix domain-containing protein [Pyrinomonadaceae bacterium]|jgi:DNA polymerase (family 10)|nr:helix-hairpin-helix domain-containing protein [Pyrinomonadaceae bacterium]